MAHIRDDDESVVIVHRNQSGQISLRTPSGDAWDMSKYVGARLYTTPQVPEGYALVPMEPTARMVIHGVRAAEYYAQLTTDVVEDCWRAMIAAAKECE